MEFQELIQNAPNFVSMEHGELVAYAYGMFAAGIKADAENAKLRELCADLQFCKRNNCLTCSHGRFCDMRFDERYAELGMEIK